MRIAIAHPFSWPEVRRGGERYADDLITYLRGAGHVVDSIGGTGGVASRHESAQGADIRLPNLRNVRRGRVQLREIETFGARALPTLARRRVDVVHAMVPTVALAAKAAGQRTVLTLLGHPTPELLAQKPVQRRVLAIAARVLDGITALSEVVADDVEAAFGRRPTVVPPGVWVDRFTAQPRSAEPVILFASAMAPEKGVDVLLRAFARVRSVRPDARLCLSGPGDPAWAFDKTREVIDAHLDHIDIVGVGDPADLPGRYARAHVTVLPSRNEAFGLVLAESLAAGTPVVGSTSGGAAEIVAHDVGRAVTHGDDRELADALLAVLDLAARPETAGACRARARLWDWAETVGPLHEAVYRTVGPRKRPV